MIEEIINTSLNGTGDSSQHGIVLFALAISTKAKNILELGVRDGESTKPFLEACKIIDGNLTSVDISRTSYNPSNEYLKYWNFVQSDALEFLKQNEKFFDLIFIDDWHASEHVYKELTLLKKVITPNTLILLHDLMYSNHPYYNETLQSGNEWEGTGPYGGVKKFILENKNFEYATIPVNNGLTLLRKIN